MKADPHGIIARGLTHDKELAINDLKALRDMEEGSFPLVAGYHKGAHGGNGDRYRWVQLEPGVHMRGRVLVKTLIVNGQAQEVPAFHLEEAYYQKTKLTLPDNMGADIPVLSGFLPADIVSLLERQVGIIQVVDIRCETPKLFSVRAYPIQYESNKVEAMPAGWRVVRRKPDFIIYDGWMHFAEPVSEQAFENHWPALETQEDIEFAKRQNRRLVDYKPLWDLMDYRTMLFVPNYEMSMVWRELAEVARRRMGQGMSPEKIIEFVRYFWQNVHYGIFHPRIARSSSTNSSRRNQR